MAGTLAELEVNIIGNTKSLDTAIDGSKKTVDKFDGKLNDMAKTVKKLLGAGALIALASKIIDVGKASLNAASTAEEVGTKFNFAFKGIEAQAEETAVQLAKTYGLAQTESKKLLGDTGDLLKGFGASANEALDFSAEIQRLSVDLADYNTVQGGASRVSKILTKSVLGNKDGLSELGVSLLDVDIKQELVRTGQDKLTGQAGKLAKAQATYTLILQQTQDAQGSFIRSEGSYEQATVKARVATADLQVELGRALLPTATKGIGIFSELTGKLGAYIKSLNDVKAAEDAQAAGISTKEQDLKLIQLKIDAEQKVLEGVEKRVAFEIEEEIGIQEGTKADLERSKNKILYQTRLLEAKKLEISNEQIAADKVRETEQAVIDKAKTDEEATASRKKQHADDLAGIEKIQEASKTDLQILNEEIKGLKNITGLTESENQKRLQSIELLQNEKGRIQDAEIDAREQAGQETLKINQEVIDQELEAEKKKFDEKIALYDSYASQVFDIANSIIEISNNVTNADLANREREAAARIADLTLETEQETALNAFKAQLTADELSRSIAETEQKISDLIAIGDENSIQQANELQRNLDNSAELVRLDDLAVTSRQDRADDIEEIERDLAEQKYKIEKAQFQATKASSAIEATIATALGIASSLPNLILAGIVGAAGAVQVGAILSQPDPPRPAFAQGGTVTGATNILAGEDKGDVLIGMGAKGAPLLEELATRLSANMGGGQTIININSLYPPNQRDLDRLAKDLYTGNIKEQQRRGIN